MENEEALLLFFFDFPLEEEGEVFTKGLGETDLRKKEFLD